VTRSVRLALVSSALLAGACGSASGQADTAEPAAAEKRVVLTIRDHGRTLAVSRRDRITLSLGGRYRWSTPRSGGAVTAHEEVSDAPTGAQLWELEPRRLGRARLTSTGSPACRPTAAGCPETARRFVVTLLVRR
jgi:hypothetical protein